MKPERYVWIFAALAVLYAAQMLGQAVLWFAHIQVFPPITAWYFGLVPYRVLFPIQFAILSAMSYVTWRFVRGHAWPPCARCAWILTRVAVAYTVLILLRYGTAVALHAELRTVAGAIPTIPHVVLAAFIYTLAHYHARGE